MFDWIRSKLSSTSEKEEAKKEKKMAKKEAKREKQQAKTEKKVAKKEGKRLKKEAKRLKKLAKQHQPEHYQPVHTDVLENVAEGNRELPEKLSNTRFTASEDHKVDRETQTTPDDDRNSSIEVGAEKEDDPATGHPGIAPPDDTVAGGNHSNDKDGQPDRMVEADSNAFEVADSKQDGAAMEDEPPFVGDAKTVAPVDDIAELDIPDDQGKEQVPTFQADFSVFDAECSLSEQKDTGRRVGRMTRSPSIPALGGVADDDPVHFVRHHRRFRIRRCDMAADPSFLWSLDWGATKRKDLEKWEVQRVNMLDEL